MELFQVLFPVADIKTYVFIPPAVAFVISFFTSMAGISGAFLLLPFQMSVLGFTTTSVTSTNFLFNVIGTPGGVYRYVKECRFAWPVALVIVAGIIPGVLAGYYIRILYLPDPAAFKIFVGVVLMLLSFKLFKDVWSNAPVNNNTDCRFPAGVKNVSIGVAAGRFDFRGETHIFSTVGLLALSLAVGVVGGIYGIGGGSVIAPFLITVFQLPVYAVAGAVLLGTFVSSVAGVIFYSSVPINGTVAAPDWLLGILFGIGGFMGMYCGAKAQKFVSEKWIKLTLGAIVFVVATKYLLNFVE